MALRGEDGETDVVGHWRVLDCGEAAAGINLAIAVLHLHSALSNFTTIHSVFVRSWLDRDIKLATEVFDEVRASK